MEYCYYCGSESFVKVVLNTQSNVLKCNNCSIAYTYPAPIIPDYGKLDFHSCLKENDIQPLIEINNLPLDWKLLLNIQKDMIEKYLPVNSRILEVGCGEGILLDELRKKKYQVFGIEPSRTAFNRALQRGINTINGYFPFQKFEEQFDVIIMSHVLEHIEKPLQIFSEIKRILPNGYLMLTQTNYKGLIPRIQKEKWYAWVPDQHYWHFTLKGLTSLLKKQGFARIDYKFSSLVHPHDWKYKLANIWPFQNDQFTAIFKYQS